MGKTKSIFKISKNKRAIPVKIVENFWNDTDTIKYIGMKGMILSDKKSVIPMLSLRTVLQ